MVDGEVGKFSSKLAALIFGSVIIVSVESGSGGTVQRSRLLLSVVVSEIVVLVDGGLTREEKSS